MKQEYKQKKKDKLKIKQNVDIQLDEYLIQNHNTNFSDFFSYKQELCGKPTFIAMNTEFSFVGTESSFVFLFKHENDYKQGFKVLGHEGKKQRGKVLFIQLSVDDQFLLVSYLNQEFVLWSLQNWKECYSSQDYKLQKAFITPIMCAPEYLSSTQLDGYYELLILDQLDCLTKIPIETNLQQQQQVHSTIPIPIYKFGEPCSSQKIKEHRVAIFDQEYLSPMSTKILDIQIMNSYLEEHIQCMDDRESNASFDSNRKNSLSTQKKSRKEGFFQKLFKSTDDLNSPKIRKNLISYQYYLLAVGFPRKVQVLKIIFGNNLNLEQSKIQILLQFQRPDAYIYDLVFNQQLAQSLAAQELMMKCVCSWGLGSFKETNKRYVLLIVNWGGREYYAFKVMSSEFKLQVVQGGHFFNPISYEKVQMIPLVCDFITNSVIFGFYSDIHQQSHLSLMTSSQFEYGVPFTLQQIEKHTNQEKHIQSISSGQYQPKFYNFKNVTISQGVMDSINDGFQHSNKVHLNIGNLCENIQIFGFSENCYILNGFDLMQIRLKRWDEYLYELSDATEWEKCFQTAINIHEGSLTLLCNIPENDIQRHICISETCCKLALTFILLELPNKQLRNMRSVLQVMQFLIQTKNEEFLFKSIEDLLVGCGYRNVFYDYLRELLQTSQANVPHEYQLKVLRMFLDMGDIDTVIRLIMNLQQINFDPKGLVDFCLENDLIEPMMHICSLINDFLTPYLRILTLLQLLEFQEQQNHTEDRQLTRLSIPQLQHYLFSYIIFCLTGQYQDHQDQIFTDKQFKSMLKDLFEYLFDSANLEKLFQISYIQSLKVLLYVFQPKIQDIFKALIQEGKEINIRVSKFVEGQIPDILDIDSTPPHLVQLARIYTLIKSTEWTHYSQTQNNLEILYTYSASFTVHVLSICPIQFTINHIVLNLVHYMGLLAEQQETYFDINWVLKGRVQKEVPQTLIRNEFLGKIIEKIDPIFSNKIKPLDELKNKAQSCKWTWMHSWCLQKQGKVLQSFYLYLQDPEPLVSEKVFIVLAQYLKQSAQEAIFEWVLKNLVVLGQENVQKLFQMLFTYCKDQLSIILREMSQIGIVEVDIKLKQNKMIDMKCGFIEYLEHRMGDIQLKVLKEL